MLYIQDAEKSISIKSLPKLLIIQIKRFKYNEKIKDLEKICSRILYPNTLKFPNQILEKDCSSPLYKLEGTITHIGHSVLSGHYVCITNSNDYDIILDDHIVRV